MSRESVFGESIGPPILIPVSLPEPGAEISLYADLMEWPGLGDNTPVTPSRK
jgi:hypothetical protein